MSTPSISSSVSYFGKRIACNTIWLIERTWAMQLGRAVLFVESDPLEISQQQGRIPNHGFPE